MNYGKRKENVYEFRIELRDYKIQVDIVYVDVGYNELRIHYNSRG